MCGEKLFACTRLFPMGIITGPAKPVGPVRERNYRVRAGVVPERAVRVTGPAGILSAARGPLQRMEWPVLP